MSRTSFIKARMAQLNVDEPWKLAHDRVMKMHSAADNVSEVIEHWLFFFERLKGLSPLTFEESRELYDCLMLWSTVSDKLTVTIDRLRDEGFPVTNSDRLHVASCELTSWNDDMRSRRYGLDEVIKGNGIPFDDFVAGLKIV